MFELVTGGSGSGKSVYAEERICQFQKENDSQLYYIATMFPYGEETQRKIDRHRVQRAGKGFETLEWYTDLAGKVEKTGTLETVLLECMSNLVANEMYMEEGAKEDTVEAVVQGVKRLKESCANLVIVTNEVFSESVPDTEEMRLYKKNFGRINSRLAEMADQVTEVFYGIPCYVKRRKSVEEQNTEGKKMEQENVEIRIIIGGCFQGKEDYARTLYPDVCWNDGSNCTLDQIRSCQGITQFHQFVRRWLQEGRTKEELLEQIFAREQEITIISDEIGCGLVPIDAFEREYREAHGRIMTELAARAKRVDRVICGIGMRLV